MIYLQNLLKDIYDGIVNLFLQFVDLIKLPFQFIYDIINYIVTFFTSFLNDLNTSLETSLNTVNSININFNQSAVGSLMQNTLELMNGIFPVTEFISMLTFLLYLWCAVLLLKLIIRVITLGQA